LDKGAPVSASPPEVSGGTIRSHAPDEPVLAVDAHPAITSKPIAAASRNFIGFQLSQFGASPDLG